MSRKLQERPLLLAICLLLMFTTLVSGAAIAQTTPTVLHNFGSYSGDALQPVPFAALTQGRDGAMYGTTQYGGANGNGAVFRIDANGNERIVYSFPSTPGAYFCVAGLVLGSDGNFYGVCVYGSSDKGSVYRVTPSGTRKILHTFTGPDGDTPRGTLVLALDGNFYGTTTNGGTNGVGTVYKLSPNGTFTTIYSFNTTDGANPVAGLIQGSDGLLYGSTQNGGVNGDGEIFKITPAGKLTVLHSFNFSDGYQPVAPLVQAFDGNYYGSTNGGGANAYGVVFQMKPSGALTVLHNFAGSGDGSYPYSGLQQAPDSNLYGVTTQGGLGLPSGDGVLFKVSTTGAYTPLYMFDGTLGQNPASAILQNTNGLFYADTESGGTAGFGTFYSINVGPVPYCILWPTSGIVGTKVGILGQGFDSSTVVDIGGANATNVVLTGSTFLSTTVPDGSSTGYVTVTTGPTTLFCNKPFKVKPVISTFSPTSGPVGTIVTINGTGLASTISVKFASQRAHFAVVSNDQITATVPSGAITGKISVTTNSGTATSAGVFTVQ